MTPAEAATFIVTPLGCVAVLVFLFLMSALAGRQPQYDPIDHDIANRNGYTLPKGGTRRLSAWNVVWGITSFVGVNGFLLMGFMFDNPVFYVLSVICGLLLVKSLRADWRRTNDRYRKAGMSIPNPSGERGYAATMVAIVLFAPLFCGAMYLVARMIGAG